MTALLAALRWTSVFLLLLIAVWLAAGFVVLCYKSFRADPRGKESADLLLGSMCALIFAIFPWMGALALAGWLS